MSNCLNCFNGCVETTPDGCVKYTGVDIPLLGIAHGDSLLLVENALSSFLLTALDGTGIVPYINPTSLCALISSYLPISGSITLINVIDALNKSICSLQTQVTNVEGDITTINNTLTVLNANYTIGCLTGVTTSSDTHDIVQAVITKLCALSEEVTLVKEDILNNYISVANIDSYITAYLNGITPSSLISSKMIPYVILPYYGEVLLDFNETGKGLGVWDKIYLCNGKNNTPDLRGRSIIGTVDQMMGTYPYDAEVNPLTIGNPNYVKGDKNGTNNVVLDGTQSPSHSHIGVATVIDPGHTHSIPTTNDYPGGSTHVVLGPASSVGTKATFDKVTGITVTIENSLTGGGLSHSNIHPVFATHYIIYIP